MSKNIDSNQKQRKQKYPSRLLGRYLKARHQICFISTFVFLKALTEYFFQDICQNLRILHIVLKL